MRCSVSIPESGVLIMFLNSCSKGPCYNGGTCLSKVCLCPAFCHGHHCEECDKDPYPPQQSVNIDSISFNVIMDQGWIVVLRRRDGTLDFHEGRFWTEYENGFGDLSSEFWLGNKYIHLLTNNGSSYKCRVEILTEDNRWLWSEYDTFSVGPSSDKYRLHLQGYNSSSTAVIIEDRSIQPDDVTYLNDNSTFTCSNFVTNRQQYTQIFKESFCADDQMSVTVVGRQMTCDNGLFLFKRTMLQWWYMFEKSAFVQLFVMDIIVKNVIRIHIPLNRVSILIQSHSINMDQGWIVVLRRRDGTLDFHEGRFWTEYENGFGDLSSEFWLGRYY
ncbi:hypothetical protein LSH36_1957g00018 [Paralvinella palmiformis]|uniref:Fibrinogen C-terminal domain-containing protein n=1 Tax=Paralvinella palmiformis TaxID=53620 RepID=A0AAD9IRF1_9ANNE|nr:hypothetical protein LSH36_1957g00018 [Paralvinella palmiformis]